MANFRQIHTKIWRDPWFHQLGPDAKILFVYLFSNEATSISGLYHFSIDYACFETGISQDRLHDLLQDFEQAGKVEFEDEYIWIKNMLKYHATKSDKLKIGIRNDVLSVPDIPIKIRYMQTNKTLFIGYQYPTVESESESEAVTEAEAQPESWDAAAAAAPVHIQATTLLCNVSGMAAIPPKELERVEQVACMIEQYGREHTEPALQAACEKWRATPRKNGTGNYAVTNMAWVDWAQEILAGGTLAQEPEKDTSQMSQAEYKEYVLGLTSKLEVK